MLTTGEGAEDLSVWDGKVVEVGFAESCKGPQAQRCECDEVEELHLDSVYVSIWRPEDPQQDEGNKPDEGMRTYERF